MPAKCDLELVICGFKSQSPNANILLGVQPDTLYCPAVILKGDKDGSIFSSSQNEFYVK